MNRKRGSSGRWAARAARTLEGLRSQEVEGGVDLPCEHPIGSRSGRIEAQRCDVLVIASGTVMLGLFGFMVLMKTTDRHCEREQ